MHTICDTGTGPGPWHTCSREGWPDGGLIVALFEGGVLSLSRRGLDHLGWGGASASAVLRELAEHGRLRFIATEDGACVPVLDVTWQQTVRLGKLPIAAFTGRSLDVRALRFAAWGNA